MGSAAFTVGRPGVCERGSFVCCKMAKQKRKESEVAEKKSKKLKKVSAVEMPAACEALPGTGTAPAEGSVSPSPEEQRVLERKLKKERKKEARRRLREAGIAAAPSPAVKRSGAALALEYLCSWAQKREDWRFQKTRQTWLLLHMYDRDQVPDEHFPALLAYLEGLRGRARELTVQKAEALMRELDEAGAGALPPGGTQRARQVLQLLS
ncbi:protein cholesin isoform X2 [Bos indicus]|uniref:Protein cholesin isoform X2 n=1 Tax=Bos indicus TaxID=9915 RepID=A0ABM4RLL1_BOSIN